MGSSTTLPMLPQPASRRDRDPVDAVFETGSSGDGWGAFLVAFGRDLCRERALEETFLGTFWGAIGYKVNDIPRR